MNDKSKDINELDSLTARGMSAPTTRGVRTSDTTTRGIRIEVQSMYMPERSAPKEAQYLFEYHVRISNVGSETAQLISRESIITATSSVAARNTGGRKS